MSKSGTKQSDTGVNMVVCNEGPSTRESSKTKIILLGLFSHAPGHVFNVPLLFCLAPPPFSSSPFPSSHPLPKALPQ